MKSVKTIKGITNCRLYIRSAPDVNAERLGVWEKGQSVTILFKTIGTSFEDSDEWYGLKNGLYSWAGGINTSNTVEELKIPKNVEIKGELLTANRFKNLSKDEQRRLIHYYIKENASELKNEYPEIQGFSVRKKLVKNQPQNYYCLHIDVIKKKCKKNETDNLPHHILFKAKDKLHYNIPTDITGVGKNQISMFIGEYEMPKKLGLSCSRKGDFPNGTIGLKIYKNGVPYLLSCYHVLCEPEMNSGITIIDSNTIFDNNAIIISPGTSDGNDHNEIADVTEGILNNTLDVALAKLRNNDDLDNEYYNYNGTPNGRIELSSEDTANKITVKIYGRTSGKKTSKLHDHYQDIVYFNNYPSGTISELHGLIVTDSISKPGDSGATVVNKDNKLIGLLVGSNSNKSYLIPINRIFRKLKLDKNVK